jgi:archaemetzincin
MNKNLGFCIFLIGYLSTMISCNKTIAPDDKPIVISIQAFEGMPENQVNFLYHELLKIYPHIVVRKPIALPHTSYYKDRNRYRADSLIRFLQSRTEDGQVTIGLTDKDISHTNGKIADYGIMGLGYQPGKSCVVSTYRLVKQNLKEQFFKLCMHELGHTQGLEHCTNSTCFMRDAEGRNHFDELRTYCQKCQEHLVGRGWYFNKQETKHNNL